MTVLHKWVLLILCSQFHEQVWAVCHLWSAFDPCHCFTEEIIPLYLSKYMWQILLWVRLFFRKQIFQSPLMLYSDRPLLTHLTSFSIACKRKKQMLKNVKQSLRIFLIKAEITGAQLWHRCQVFKYWSENLTFIFLWYSTGPCDYGWKWILSYCLYNNNYFTPGWNFENNGALKKAAWEVRAWE